MPVFKQESLELLRRRVDLAEVVSSHVELKKAGGTYKGLCPFHDEKSPSFIVDVSDHHYHCYGCGAHGDAIGFLMELNKMSFSDAVEALAQRFGVHLDHEESSDAPKGPPKQKLREVMTFAGRFFHFCLLHTEEGQEALNYLYQRGLDLAFIRRFEIGLAPSDGDLLPELCREKRWGFDLLETVGLAVHRQGRRRSFFDSRITFPIRDPMGNIIGFSARKYKEETFGGKYVNTPETPLFKKSRVLFGLDASRRRIAKEHQVIIVEGQIDALRLIEEGFNFSVAGQGTAFGKDHAAELIKLGVQKVFLAMDADEAGREASAKVGNLFQKEGVEVRVVEMEPGSDPDTLLREEGPEAFHKRLDSSIDYLTFLVNHNGRYINLDTPSGKNQLVTKLTAQIREWSKPVMVHESLRKLAGLAHVPEEIVGVGQQPMRNYAIQQSATVRAHGGIEIDPDRILEMDLLRLLLLTAKEKPELAKLIQREIAPEALHNGLCQETYRIALSRIEEGKPLDLFSLAMSSEKIQEALDELNARKVNPDRLEELVVTTVNKILERNWLQQRQQVQVKIQSATQSYDESMVLVQEMADLGNQPPKAEFVGQSTKY